MSNNNNYGRITRQELSEVLNNEFDTMHNEIESNKTQLAQTEQEVSIVKTTRKIQPLHINTFDGSNEPYHPAVYYNANGWNGWNYWMAYTPYPVGRAPYIDRWECPSIAVSRDGLLWLTPTGFQNPLQDLTPEQITRKDYFSDPHIFVNNGVMEVWYRHTNGADINITDTYRVTSSNGVTWSAPEKVLDATNADNGIGTSSPPFRSPTIIVQNGKYYCYYTHNDGMRVAETSDPSTGIWTNRRELNMPTGHKVPWHAGLFYETSTGIYHMIAYYHRNTIDYLKSTDGINFTHEKQLIDAKKREYSNLLGLYQAVPVKIGNTWRVYSSCRLRVNRTPAGIIIKHGVFVMMGDSLTTLSEVDMTTVQKSRQYFDASIVLTSGNKPNSDKNRIVLTLSDDESSFTSIQNEFHSVNGRPYPGYTSDKGTNPITSVRFKAGAPTDFNYPGELQLNTTNNEDVYFSVSESNWIKLTNRLQTYKNSKDVALQATINVSDADRVIVYQVTNNTPITSFSGGISGQEIILINVLPNSASLTIKHNTVTPGAIFLKSGADTVVNNRTTIRLLNINGNWYEV